jgi:hypothetical protein
MGDFGHFCLYSSIVCMVCAIILKIHHVSKDNEERAFRELQGQLKRLHGHRY